MSPARDGSRSEATHEPAELRDTPTWVVAVSALLLSIPLALCCYLLLNL